MSQTIYTVGDIISHKICYAVTFETVTDLVHTTDSNEKSVNIRWEKIYSITIL